MLYFIHWRHNKAIYPDRCGIKEREIRDKLFYLLKFSYHETTFMKNFCSSTSLATKLCNNKFWREISGKVDAALVFETLFYVVSHFRLFLCHLKFLTWYGCHATKSVHKRFNFKENNVINKRKFSIDSFPKQIGVNTADF